MKKEKQKNTNSYNFNFKKILTILLFFLNLFILSCGKNPNEGPKEKQINSSQVQVGLYGGQPVVENKLPAVVALVRLSRIFCSGTLIHPRVVLTAAHCVDSLRAMDISVYVGNGIEGGILPKTAKVIAVEKSGYHPSYHSFRGDVAGYILESADVGYLVLKEEIKIPVIPILQDRLNINSIVKKDQIVQLTGFGMRHLGLDKKPNELKIGVKYWANSDIKKVLNFELEIWSNGVQVNRGDSGGPVLIQTASGPKVLAINSRISAIYDLNEGYPVHRFVLAYPYTCWLESETKIDLSLEGDCSGYNPSAINKNIENLLSDRSESVASMPSNEENDFKEIADFAVISNLRTHAVRKKLVELFALENDENKKLSVLTSLSILGVQRGEIGEYLLSTIKSSPDSILTIKLIDMLIDYRHPSEEEQQIILDSLQSKNLLVKKMSLTSISNLKLKTEYALSKLMDFIKDDYNHYLLKKEAKDILLIFGNSRSLVKDFFVQMLVTEKGFRNQILAIEAIGELDIETDEVINKLIEFAQNWNSLIRETSLKSLSQFTQRPYEIMETLFKKILERPTLLTLKKAFLSISSKEDKLVYLQRILESEKSNQSEIHLAKLLINELEKEESI